jgi:hypothetical protein
MLASPWVSEHGAARELALFECALPSRSSSLWTCAWTGLAALLMAERMRGESRVRMLHIVVARLGDDPTILLSTCAHLLPRSDAQAAEAVAAVLADKPLTNAAA